MKPPCAHCGLYPASGGRSLCYRCGRDAGLRRRYRSAHRCNSRGVGNFNGGYGLPAAETGAAPGSPEKLAVLCERAAEGVALHSPADYVPDRGLHPTRGKRLEGRAVVMTGRDVGEDAV